MLHINHSIEYGVYYNLSVSLRRT